MRRDQKSILLLNELSHELSDFPSLLLRELHSPLKSLLPSSSFLIKTIFKSEFKSPWRVTHFLLGFSHVHMRYVC